MHKKAHGCKAPFMNKLLRKPELYLSSLALHAYLRASVNVSRGPSTGPVLWYPVLKDTAPDHLSGGTAVFAMAARRWVRGRAACASLILTSECNLCRAPLAAGTVSWGRTGRKTMNSWTDFLSVSCWALGGKFAKYSNTKRRWADWICWHSTF